MNGLFLSNVKIPNYKSLVKSKGNYSAHKTRLLPIVANRKATELEHHRTEFNKSFLWTISSLFIVTLKVRFPLTKSL